MLAFFRAFSKSWAAKLLFGVLLIGFTVWGIQGGLVPHISTDVITAGQRRMGENEFRSLLDRQLSRARAESGSAPTLEQLVKSGQAQEIATQLAQELGFAAWLDRAGIRPAQSQTMDALRDVQALRPAFNPVTGVFDQKIFAEILSQNGLNTESFLEKVHDDLAQRDLTAAIAGATVTPRLYAALTSNWQLQQRDASYFALDAKTLGPIPTPSDADLKKFYTDVSSRLARPETRALTVVIFDPRQVMGSVTVNPADVQKTFDFRKDSYSTPEKRTFVEITAKDAKAAAQAAAALRAGQTPDAAAKAAGGEASAQTDLAKTAVPDTHVADTVFNLKPGQTSDAFQTDAGYAVVKLQSVTPGHVATLEEKRGEIENQLRLEAARSKIQTMVQQYSDARDAGATAAQAAAKVGADIKTLPPMTAEGQTYNGEQIKVSPTLLQKILGVGFSLPKGGQSDAQKLVDDVYFAVGVDSIHPPYTPTLAEVRPALVAQWTQQQIAKGLQAKADGLIARLKKGEPIAQVAASIHADVKHGAGIQRPSGRPTDLQSYVASLIFNAKPGEPFAYPVPANPPAMLIGRVDAVHAPTPIAAAAAAARVQPTMNRLVAQDLFNGVRTSANDKIKPKVDTGNLNAALGVSGDQGQGAPAQ